jgi:hypothetical protein
MNVPGHHGQRGERAHINAIFAKLSRYPGDVGHRRVLAVLRYLGGAAP